MAEDKEKIIIDFESNADQTKKGVDNLATSLDVVEEKTEDISKSNKKLEESQSKVNKSTNKQKAGFEDLGGGIGSTITQVKGLGKQFLLLLANPVVLFLTAIVGALAILYKSFTSTKEGGEQMDRIFAGIGATIDVLRDRVLQIADAISSLSFSKLKAAITGIGEEITEEFNKAADATRQLQQVADASRDLGVSRAKLNRDLAESEQILTDVNATYEEKQKALQKVSEAEQQQTALELENARKKLKAIQTQNALSDSSSESLQAEADAKKELYALEQKSAEDRRKVGEFNKRLDGEEAARTKAINEERKRIANERKAREDKELAEREAFNQSILDKELELLRRVEDAQAVTAQQKLDLQKERDRQELELLEQKGVDTAEMMLLNAELYAIAQEEIDIANLEAKQLADEEALLLEEESQRRREELRQEEINNEKIAKEAKIQAQKDVLTASGDILNGVKALAGKNKAVQKAAIVADGAVSLGKIGVNTAEAVSKDTAKGFPLSIPLVAADIAVGAASAIKSISNTKKALSALGGGGSAGAPPSLPQGISATPQAGFQASSENQIATSITQAQTSQEPVKAYVVISDVNKGQKLEDKIIEENSFG